MQLEHADALVDIQEQPNGKRRITVRGRRPDVYIHRTTCETAYPISLIQLILEVKGPGYVCDEIARDEDPTYIEQHLRTTVFAHVPPEDFKGKVLLDFGCGSAASTMILRRLLPDTRIVGVELDESLLRIARARAAFYGADVQFSCSPSGDRLPEDLEHVDFIMLSAVYEHLLPNERRVIVPQLWSLLNVGGIFFVDETPARWFPIESHTSGLPFVNYLPDGLAHMAVRIFSKRDLRGDSWESLLRKGVRGASKREIIRTLGRRADVLRPSYGGMRTPVEVWYEGYAKRSSGKTGRLKQVLGKVLGLLYAATGIVMIPYLSLAIRKK